MKGLFEQKNCCCGCGACMAACPSQAIEMVSDREGIPYPKIIQEKCVDCGQCKRVCPVKHHNFIERERLYFGAQAKDDSLRFSSSSGGVFPVLAQHILKQGGVVFGAAMEADGTVRHRDIQMLSDLPLLQKTKYVQSDMGDCYEKIARYLRGGGQVLFTGTPCQCQALKLYLGKERENLILVDLVCYGVPSPGIWKKYVRELERKYKGKFAGYCFRDKREKDNGHTVSVRIGDKEYACPMRQDSFCRVYFRNYTIRPACSSCEFCTVNRESDMTLGDFWEIEKRKPEMDDGMGTSMVILHSEKAKKIWEEIKKEFRYFPCEKEEILQPRLCTPSKPSSRRGRFMFLNRFLSLSMAERLLRR